MRASCAATTWQLLSADALHDLFLNKELAGGLLADDVGLRKTWTAVTFALKVCPSHNPVKGFLKGRS